MVARNRVEWVYRLLFLLLVILALMRQAGAEEASGPTGRRTQQHPWKAEGEDVDEDPWTEESERINRLRFEREGNGRATIQDHPSDDPLVDEEHADMQRLGVEAQERQRATRLAWEARAGEIQKKWGKVRESGPSVYVEYTSDNDAFGGVDYDKGFLEVGAISPGFLRDAARRVERLLSERLCFLLGAQSIPGVRDLEGQVTMPGTGRAIRQAEVQEFSRYAVRSGESPHSYTAPDGVKRVRRQIRIELVPDHLRTRVSQYLPYVQKAARIYEVEPELILAVIQTESVFNPRAVSDAGAIGLMQLVPGSGALEASQLVYGETRLLTREELSRPDKNIELGAAYLRILLTRHFRDYSTEPKKLLFLVIASYNCGPRAVKMAIGERDIRSLSPAELYDLLIRVVPEETQVYLQRVVQNMKQYRSIMGTTAWPGCRIAGLAKPRFTPLFVCNEGSVLALSSAGSPALVLSPGQGGTSVQKTGTSFLSGRGIAPVRSVGYDSPAR